MTDPRSPREALERATQRLATQREAARTLSNEIAQERQAQTEAQRETGEMEQP
jgi:multidrug resistance efflux pump